MFFVVANSPSIIIVDLEMPALVMQTNIICWAIDLFMSSLEITSTRLQTESYLAHHCWLVNWTSEESFYLRGGSANILSRHKPSDSNTHTHTHTLTHIRIHISPTFRHVQTVSFTHTDRQARTLTNTHTHHPICSSKQQWKPHFHRT